MVKSAFIMCTFKIDFIKHLASLSELSLSLLRYFILNFNEKIRSCGRNGKKNDEPPKSWKI